jgi:hypothetical protein
LSWKNWYAIEFYQYDSIFYLIGARLFLFFSFLLAFASLIAGAWVLFGGYIYYKKEKLYPALAIFSQNLAIFMRYIKLLNLLLMFLFLLAH